MRASLSNHLNNFVSGGFFIFLFFLLYTFTNMNQSLKENIRGTIFYNSVSIIIGIFALATFAGFSFHNAKLMTLGQSLGFAPMPLPFREMEAGAENFDVRFTVQVISSGLNTTFSRSDVARFLSIKNRPHRAAIPYYTIISYFPVIPNILKYPAFSYVCTKMKGDKAIFTISYTGETYNYSVICKQ